MRRRGELFLQSMQPTNEELAVDENHEIVNDVYMLAEKLCTRAYWLLSLDSCVSSLKVSFTTFCESRHYSIVMGVTSSLNLCSQLSKYSLCPYLNPT
jgi:hypothetical protein